MTKATYVPDDDEAVRTNFLGRRWAANVPQDVSENAASTMEVSVKQTAPNGQTILVTQERRVPHLEILRAHPQFNVEGEQPRKPPSLDINNINTSDQYKAYAVHWFRKVTDPAAFRDRWENEAELRDTCGVTDDDLRFLDQFIGDRLKRRRPSRASG